MELKEFVTGFANQFEETDPSEIEATTDFHSLDEWNSLMAMSIVAFIKVQYKKTVTVGEVQACQSVEAVYNLVMNK